MLTRRLLNVTLSIQYVGGLVYKYNRTGINPVLFSNRTAFITNSVEEIMSVRVKSFSYKGEILLCYITSIKPV